MIGQPITIRDYTSNLKKPTSGVSGNALPVPADLGQAIGLVIVGDLKSRMSRGVSPNGQRYQPLGRPRINGGDKPLLDTGLLRNSLTHMVTPDGVTVGTNLVYGPVHQFGATILPKRTKYLAIPLTKAAKLAGSPRRIGKLTFRPTSKGGLLIDAKKVAQFVLVKSVTIPARPFVGLSSEVRPYIEQMVAEHYGNVMASQLANPSAQPLNGAQ